jgi:hypothetical protein
MSDNDREIDSNLPSKKLLRKNPLDFSPLSKSTQRAISWRFGINMHRTDQVYMVEAHVVRAWGNP